MNWKFWERKPKRVITMGEVSSRIRGFLLDAQLPEAHAMAVVLGCSPISDDVAFMEEEQSDKRVEEIGILTPLLYAFAHSMAEATQEVQREALKGEVPEEVWRYSRKLVEQIALGALMGTTSQLVDMGLLHLDKRLKKVSKK